jgi:hypothetical protein
MKLSDETEVIHSHLKNEKGLQVVLVHFERAKLYGFDSARISLPSYEWLIRDGFSDDEIKAFEDFTAGHAHNLFYFAEIGGIPKGYAVC